MRLITRSGLVPKPPEKIWAWLCDLKNLDALYDCLGLRRSGCRHVLEGSGPIKAGSKIVLLAPSGKPYVTWTVIDCVPNAALTLVASREGFIDGLHMQWSFELEGLEGSRTNAKVGFGLVFHRSALEIFSFNPLVTFLYGWSVGRMLWMLKSNW